MTLIDNFALLALALALLLGFAVTRYAYKSKSIGTVDPEWLKREIARREKAHLPRKGLRKQLVEAVRRELEA